MTRRVQPGTVLARVVASGIAVLAIAWLGRLAPFSIVPAGDPGRPGDAAAPPAANTLPAQGNASRSGGPISAFVFDGVPLATETRRIDRCDAASWSPDDAAGWRPGSLLLSLERSDHQATAVWMGAASGATTYHVAQLTCDGGRGELLLAFTPRPIDAETLAGLGEPVTHRSGPVPLLDEAVQLLALRNLDWNLYLDQPAEPHDALHRLETALRLRGWVPRALPAAGDPLRVSAPAEAVEALDSGRVLVREGGLCLLRSFRADGRDLLLTACRGLA